MTRPPRVEGRRGRGTFVDDAPVSNARCVHRDGARRQSARGRARRRRARRRPHAGDRRRVQPVRDRVRLRAEERDQHRAGEDLHAEAGIAVRRPSHDRNRRSHRPPPRRRSAGRPGSADRARGSGRRRRLQRAPSRGPGARGLFRAAEAARAARRQAAAEGGDRRGSRASSRRTSASTRHEPSLFSAGAPYLFVPVRSLDAIGRAAPGAMCLGDQGRSRDLSLYARSRARRIGLSCAHVRPRVGRGRRPGDRQRRRRVRRRRSRLRPPERRRAHADHRAGLRDGPAKPDRARPRRSRPARSAPRRSAARSSSSPAARSTFERAGAPP